MKTDAEWEIGFDTLFNNITSNQAPGLNTHEKCIFLTKAEYEIVANLAKANSKGNTTGEGFDDSAKRQVDFSSLMETETCLPAELTEDEKLDLRSHVFIFPSRAFVPVNETLIINKDTQNPLQVMPLRYDDYTRLMSKPFKRPVKGQAWRLMTKGSDEGKFVEIIAGPGTDTLNEDNFVYKVRFVRRPKPIIIGSLDGLTIDGYCYIDDHVDDAVETSGCEVDESLHDMILQRAVELAKIAWTSTGSDNTQMVMAAGQRSE